MNRTVLLADKGARYRLRANVRGNWIEIFSPGNFAYPAMDREQAGRLRDLLTIVLEEPDQPEVQCPCAGCALRGHDDCPDPEAKGPCWPCFVPPAEGRNPAGAASPAGPAGAAR